MSSLPNFLPFAYIEKGFKPFADANISIATHALHYGTGAFGGMRGYVDASHPNVVRLFRLHEHTKRLAQSALFIGGHFEAKEIETIFIDFIKTNKPTINFYLRPLVYNSSLTLTPKNGSGEDIKMLVYGMELGDYLSPHGISCCFSSWMRQADASFPLRGKITGAYITSSLSRSEAEARGFDEAILMNHLGKVSEGSAMNLFMVRDGVLYTPGVDQDILEGITRKSVIEVAKHLGYKVVERPIDKTELFIADEVFLTGSAARILPIRKLEHHQLNQDTPITNHLQSTFADILSCANQDFAHWMTDITF